ncbi:MAG: hypothetical protein JEZ00_11535 [Anaerolineaceae bacterium]|nr:hypothetical protein [Anaerolineaceae bacterium]
MKVANEFSPEKTWQAALDKLERDLSKADFNTWVKPTQLISSRENTFVIGCTNEYGREWLESHIVTTLQQSLSNLMEREILVRFIVPSQEIREKTQVSDDKPIMNVTDDDLLDLDVHYASIRNALLEPGRVVRLPVYMLRWLPYVGSQIVFVVMALWQEYYLASSGKTIKGRHKVSARAENICQWAGISRAQFFRLLQSGSGLHSFVRKIETDHELDRYSGRTKKSSNKYELFDSPLTPGDAEDLKTYLLDHGIKESPEAALQLAISANPKEILQYPIREPPDDFDKKFSHHLSVKGVVKELLGYRLTLEQSDLTDQLTARLLSEGDFIPVSWYFLKNWLPVLGADAAMFILVLRNLCYFNDKTGEIRDEVWMDGGYEAIAKRLGINNPRVVANWLPARIERGKRTDKLSERTTKEFSRRQQLQELLGLFVERIDHRINSSGSYGWKFKVQRVDPLIPQHQAIHQAVTSLLVQSEDQGVLKELNARIGELSNGCYETVKNGPKVVLRRSDLANDCSETLKGILKDCLETLDMEANDCFETLLKILISLKDTQKKLQPSTNQGTCDSNVNTINKSLVAVKDAKGEWSLEKLLARADKNNQKLFLAQEKSAHAFVSWVIHGSSQANIQNPYSLAIAKLKQSPGVSAGGVSDRLAAVPFGQLIQWIEDELNFQTPSNPDWRMAFAQVKHERIRLLADSLGLRLNFDDGI